MAQKTRNLIVGTGPAALSAALQLQRLHVPFEVLDVGNDLDEVRAGAIETLKSLSPPEWRETDRRLLFPPPKTSARGGVEKRMSFGSSFPYERPEFLSLTTENCAIDVSHGFGGFGNVWGAAILPFVPPDLEGWPADVDLGESYRNVAAFMGASGERDRLEHSFPVYHTNLNSLRRSPQAENLMRNLEQRHETLADEGISFGRARVAVNSSGDASSCRYCGHCLEGCVYGAIFNPRSAWRRLKEQGVRINKGLYALEFKQRRDGVTLVALQSADGAAQEWDVDRLFLGLGAVGTTRLIARSLGLLNQAIRMKDSQYFFFPLLSYRRAATSREQVTLADVFIEILNPRIGSNYVHLQVYGLNEIFGQTIRDMLPTFLRSRRVLDPIEGRFHLIQGFLHSSLSSELELTLRSSDEKRDHLHVRAHASVKTLPAARKVQALLRRKLAPFGVIPPFYLKVVPAGRSFHLGSSFPMAGKHEVFSSDSLARPAGLSHVHILDAASFPSIPATTITYPVMANADRVVLEAHRKGLLQ